MGKMGNDLILAVIETQKILRDYFEKGNYLKNPEFYGTENSLNAISVIILL
jgi:hypothetical protein